jgi:hypothetical protein
MKPISSGCFLSLLPAAACWSSCCCCCWGSAAAAAAVLLLGVVALGHCWLRLGMLLKEPMLAFVAAESLRLRPEI